MTPRTGSGGDLEGQGEQRERGGDADIDEERRLVRVLRTYPPFFQPRSFSFAHPTWKDRARVTAKEDTKGRSPLAWNLTLHRRVLSAARSRDTAISGAVNSRILNGTLTDTLYVDQIRQV